MSIGTILVILLVIILLGGIGGPSWGWQPGYGAGWYGNGGIGLILLIVLVLVVLGRF